MIDEYEIKKIKFGHMIMNNIHVMHELKDLENLYFKKKKPCLLLVNKNLSFDNSFKGDFNLRDGVISRDNSNEFIFTGLQILDESVFSSIKDKIFSMNKIWNYLIEENSLVGNESKQKFYHLNNVHLCVLCQS